MMHSKTGGLSASDEHHSIEIERCLRFPRVLLEALGTWPGEMKRLKFIRIICPRLAMFLLALFIFLEMIDLVTSNHGLLHISYTIMLIPRQLCTIRKIYIFIFCGKFRRFIYGSEFQFFSAPRYLSPIIQKFQTRCYETAKLSIVLFITFMIGFMPIWKLSFFKRDENFVNSTNNTVVKHKLLFSTWHPFDFDQHQIIFNVILVLQSFTMLFASVVIAVFNIFFISLAATCSRLFDHLYDVLLSLHETLENDTQIRTRLTELTASETKCRPEYLQNIRSISEYSLNHETKSNSNDTESLGHIILHRAAENENNIDVRINVCDLLKTQRMNTLFNTYNGHSKIKKVIHQIGESNSQENLNNTDVEDFKLPNRPRVLKSFSDSNLECSENNYIFRMSSDNQLLDDPFDNLRRCQNFNLNLSQSDIFLSNESISFPKNENVNKRSISALNEGLHNTLESEEKVMETLRYAVQHHQRSVRFVYGVNDIFSGVMLLDVWTVVLIMCVLAFQVVSSEEGALRTSALAKNFILHLIFFALICWAANEVMVKSSTPIHAAANHASWLCKRTSTRNVAHCLATYSYFPLRLSAGPFYTLSLETFTALLSLTFSYFMFLYQIYESKDKS